MRVHFLIQGRATTITEVPQMPCLGEVINIGDCDFVVTGLHLRPDVVGAREVRILNLQPVCSEDEL